MANRNPSPKTRFKPGHVANPRGAGAHDPFKRELKRLTVIEFRDIIEAALTSNLSGLKSIIQNPNSSVLKIGVARSLAKAIEKGDWRTINEITERLVGKLPDKLELSGTSGGPIRAQLTPQMISDPELFKQMCAIEESLRDLRDKHSAS